MLEEKVKESAGLLKGIKFLDFFPGILGKRIYEENMENTQSKIDSARMAFGAEAIRWSPALLFGALNHFYNDDNLMTYGISFLSYAGATLFERRRFKKAVEGSKELMAMLYGMWERNIGKINSSSEAEEFYRTCHDKKSAEDLIDLDSARELRETAAEKLTSGDSRTAHRLLAKSIRLYEFDPKAYLLLGEIYLSDSKKLEWNLTQEKLRKARKCFENALLIGVHGDDVCDKLAAICDTLQDYDAARKYARLSELESDDGSEQE